MLKNTSRWRADRGARAVKTVGAIAQSITALDDEDLLDLHDIFVTTPTSPLGTMAADEMRRRKLTV